MRTRGNSSAGGHSWSLTHFALSTLFAVALSHTALASDAVLRLRNGAGFEIAGDLRKFDGTTYEIKARSFGHLKLDAALYECAGPGCQTGKPAPAPVKQQKATLTFDSQPDSSREDFIIEGADAVTLSLLPDLIRGYAASIGGTATQHLGADHRQIKFVINRPKGQAKLVIDVKRSDTSTALSKLASRKASIAITNRPLAVAERQAMPPAARRRLREHVIALDGLAVIVAPGNPAKSIRLEDLSRIFKGEVTDWSQLGFHGGPIHLYSSAEKGGASERFGQIALNLPSLTLPPLATVLPDEAELSDAVARDPQGIAVTSLAFIRNARGLDVANACGAIWRLSPFAVKSEEYPLSRRIYLYLANEKMQPAARSLVDFALSDQGQAIVRSSQLIDQNVEHTDAATEAGRFDAAKMGESETTAAGQAARAAALQFKTGRRVSTTFRFANNSAVLDAKARQDLSRIAGLIKSPQVAGKTIVLAGFSDTIGDFSSNLRLSRQRANSVRTALGWSGAGVRIEGYGPIAPVACNGADKDRFLNRRVEVWVLDGGQNFEPAVQASSRRTKRAQSAVGPRAARKLRS